MLPKLFNKKYNSYVDVILAVVSFLQLRNITVKLNKNYSLNINSSFFQRSFLFRATHNLSIKVETFLKIFCEKSIIVFRPAVTQHTWTNKHSAQRQLTMPQVFVNGSCYFIKHFREGLDDINIMFIGKTFVGWLSQTA